jgi:hypothetical protein
MNSSLANGLLALPLAGGFEIARDRDHVNQIAQFRDCAISQLRDIAMM